MKQAWDLAVAWSEEVKKSGALACAETIRGCFVLAEAHEMEQLMKALGLLSKGKPFLEPDDLKSLAAVLSSPRGRELAGEPLESERLEQLRGTRDELKAHLEGMLAETEEIAAEQKALEALSIRKNQMEREIADLRQRLERLKNQLQ